MQQKRVLLDICERRNRILMRKEATEPGSAKRGGLPARYPLNLGAVQLRLKHSPTQQIEQANLIGAAFERLLVSLGFLTLLTIKTSIFQTNRTLY